MKDLTKKIAIRKGDDFYDVVSNFYPLSTNAEMYSLFILAMFSREIPFGHSTSQAPVLEQFPNPSSSIAFTMFRTLLFASILPCGKSAY